MKIRLPFLAEIADSYIRENFKFLDKHLLGDSLLKGKFVFYEKTLSSATYPATLTIPHGLDFIPKDVIQTSCVGGNVLWYNELFTRTNITLLITGPLTVRFFLGRYEE